MPQYMPFLIAGAIALVFFIAFLVFQKMSDVRRAAWLRKLDEEEADQGSLILPEETKPKTAIGRMDQRFDDLILGTGLGISTPFALALMALCIVLLGGIPLLWREDFFLATVGIMAGLFLPILFFLFRRQQFRWQIQNQLPDAFF